MQRLQPETGFRLTITLALLGVSVLIFVGLLRDVLANDGVALFDSPIISYVAAHRLDSATSVMEGITSLGSDAFLIVLTGAGGLVLRFRTGSWRPLLLLTGNVLGATLVNSVAKVEVARPRPPVVWAAVSSATAGFAFPSGHSTKSTAAYGALAFLLARIETDRRKKVGWLAIGALIALLVGISRIYLGVHWPTDVMAGWVLGLAWLALISTTVLIIGKMVTALRAVENVD